jgi:thiamin-phosphate kinase
MMPGKVPSDLLEALVFNHLGGKDSDIVLGPGIGQDASLLRVGDNIIVASTDPITGSVEEVGWLAVHVNANDIATFGVAPRWFLTSIMLPSGCAEEEIGRIMSQIDDAARSLGISVVGGHTEITEGIEHAIVAGFMIGITSEGKYVTSSGAQTGDRIILTKSIGIEGTAILASEGAEFLQRTLDEESVRIAQLLREQISVVKEGLVAFQTGHLTAMHDPTEGGLSGGIHEICDASRVGFEIDLAKVPIHPVTQMVCDVLETNVMELISSGCMIMTCKAEAAGGVIRAIEEEGIPASDIGMICKDTDRRVYIDNGIEVTLERPETDALWAALKKLKNQ